MLTAEELHRRALAALNGGRMAQSRRLLVQARERADDVEISARIDLTEAYHHAETGDRERAREICDAVLGRPGTGPETRAAAHAQRGLLAMLAGDTDSALAHLGSALAAAEATASVVGRSHLNRGGVHLQRGEVDAAEADFAAALAPLAAAGEPLEAAMAEHNLGYCLLMRGDLLGALRRMDAARTVLAPLSPVSEATCDQDRAEVLLPAGQLVEGRNALAAAARAYGLARLRRRQAEAELALAQNLLTSDPVAAEVAAKAAGRRFRASGVHAWAVRADGLALEAAMEQGRAGPRVLESAGAVAQELRGLGLRWPSLKIVLHTARAELLQGRTAGARARLATVRTGSGTPLEVRLLDREVRAELAAAQGRRADALRHLRAGLADLHAWQSSFGSLDLQTGVAGQGVRLGVRGLALAVESGRPAVLLEWSERARMLASRVQPVRAPEDEALSADLSELRRLAGEEGSRDPAREAELRRRVRERAWQHHGSGEVSDPVTLAALRSALDPQTALVAYVVTAERLTALVVTDAGTTWADLGTRPELDELVGGLLPDLDVAAVDLPEPMSGAVRGALTARLDRLAGLLVTPVLEAVGERRVVLTPSGVLAGVPWPLLPGYVGRPVTVAQSATSWLARRTTPLRTATAGLVAGPRVARAEDEVFAAAAGWDGARVLVGAAATAAAVSELAEQVDVLHVAAHGRHSAENPMFSGLTLADGPWFGYDIDRLRSVPDVVLLSACEVGRSNVRWGEELIGMAGAWLHAGSRCVIASAAAISDRAAYDVLVAVHRQLAAGVDPAAALAAAVPAVSTDTAPVPLVCFG
ncbi:CHAT domain-containing protein [Nocardioides pantholopis]|uniref:CHAT domain-containing protein n=1 Tax=Nocardioides pantholopis TaxID=2483798 RepID=UPI000F087731|nr:CHAT domain-containing protein [Nocardioides pantholopis]